MITTHDPRQFIDPVPRGMEGLVLVDPVELGREHALPGVAAPADLTLYDVSIDEKRPATQDDIDGLLAACCRGVKLREGLKALAADAKAKEADVPLTAVEALLTAVEAKPEA